jgi:hypothetical protein
VWEHQGNLKPVRLRVLQQEASQMADGEVKYVSTAVKLHEAMLAGARHIVITDHLDLTVIETSKQKGLLSDVKLVTSTSTLSIRVRLSRSCLASVSGGLPLSASLCVVLVLVCHTLAHCEGDPSYAVPLHESLVQHSPALVKPKCVHGSTLCHMNVIFPVLALIYDYFDSKKHKQI